MEDESKSEARIGSAAKFILVDGMLVRGATFAAWMFVAELLVKKFYRGVPISEFLQSSDTWTRLWFYFLMFGLIMAIIHLSWTRGKEIDKYRVTTDQS